MASNIINLKALGLNFSPNALELPPGSLLEANNVIIRRDDVIESRRGYKLFGEEIPVGDTTPQFAKQLMVYRQRILRHYGNKIAYQDGVLNSGEARFTEFSGLYNEVASGLRIKSVQAKNGNFYFTTNEGIKKISAVSGEEFTSTPDYITQSGGIKALDLQAKTNTSFGDTSSFLPENSTVAYKLVWGKIDANNVEILGTPSERMVVYNPLKTLLQMDLNRLLIYLDDLNSSNSLINSADYYSSLSVTNESDASELRTKMISLAKKLDEDLVFADSVGPNTSLYEPLVISSVSVLSGIVTINFAAGTASVSDYFKENDKINLVGFTSGSVAIDNINGSQLVGPVAASSFTFIARNYTSSTPFGVSGVFSSYTADVSGIVTVTTTADHGLKNGQQITIQNATAPTVNGIKTITYKSPTSFEISVPSGSVSTPSTTGIWSILISSVAGARIESNKYRSITEPAEVVAAEDTGIIDTRGTGAQLFSQQTYLNTIISNLKEEKNSVINTTQSTFIGLETFSLTKTSSVDLEFTVPHNIDNTYYYKLYRTETLQITSAYSSPLEDVVPGVDYRLVSQNYYVESLKTTNNTLIINDNVPSAFLNKENLYTNVNTSGGADAKPNDYPPFAYDINTFKGYLFYANTKLKQIKDLELLGVAKFKDELAANRAPKILISDGTQYNNCEITFVRGVKQVTTISVPISAIPNISPKTFPSINVDISTNTITTSVAHGLSNGCVVKFTSTGSLPSPINSLTDYYIISSTPTTFKISLSNGGPEIDLTSQGSGTHTVTYVSKYIDINSANNETQYRIWFDLTGSDIAPSSESKKLIKIYIATNTQDFVGQKIAKTLNSLIADFSSSYNLSTNILTVSNLIDGLANEPSFGGGMSGFSYSITTSGVGESVDNRTAVVSSNDLLLPAVATLDATKSFIRVLNRNTAAQVLNPSIGFDTYAYYSGTNPGLFLLEGTEFVDSPYYLSTNNSTVGTSFSPDISPLQTNGVGISNAGGMALLTFSSAHNFLNGETIIITNSNTPIDIDGVYEVEYVSSTELKITATPPVAGSYSFSYSKSTLSEFSDNYKKKNRVYYSKFEQPESVSVNVLTGNFIDIGSEEKKILRIFPLRDSLFIFKEDGLYRLSAETEPFIVALFDSSCILAAPDSVSVSQNLVYCWTTQGISTVSESGVTIVSRPIDTEVLKLQSNNYPEFSTSTFGIGYESDNSYLVWTVSRPSDTHATQAFRYSSLTGTWTKYTKTNNCGILNPVDDRLYLGSPVLSFIEQERKTFTREDYSDYQFDFTLGANNYFNDTLKVSEVSNIKVGDVVAQVQQLTTYQFNSLLKKLDGDPGLIKTGLVTTATLTSPTVITSNNHNLLNGETITIRNSNTVPSLDGEHVITYITPNTFSIPVFLSSFVSGGEWSTSNYYSTLFSVGGDNMRSKLVDLANKLDLAGLPTTDFYNKISSKVGTITSSLTTLTNPTILTSTNHGLFTGRMVSISGSNSIPSIDGIYQVTRINDNQFSIPVNLISSGSLNPTWSTVDNNFDDIKACYNQTIFKLNSDVNVAFSNYVNIESSSLQEAVIINIDRLFKKITLNKTLDFIQGPFVVYNSIESSVVYSPNSFGDPLSFKQIREATAMFANKAFTSATLSFATDLLPVFNDVQFSGDGAGLFGHDNFGYNFFGGVSNSAPLRTIIPLTCQRCRYLNVKFTHSTAREQYALYGITLIGRTVSTRAYR